MTKIALVHDHLGQNGGAERVLSVFQEMFPDAPTFTTIWNKKVSDPVFANKDIRTSFIQNFPLGVRKYQWYLPLMPVAFERFDFSPFDLVISSNSALAKGVIPPEGVPHVCYCYTPTRYLWSDRQSYIDSLEYPGWIKTALNLYLHYLRIWDLEAARRVDHFIAISTVVRDRIRHYYKRESEVIHPPVAVNTFEVGDGAGGYYVTGGRLTYYKRFDIAVQAFSKTGVPLYIYGDGPELAKLQDMASSNVKFLGRVSEKQLRDLYKNAIGFINPQEEDFGITMVEAMAAGRPVIAYQKGGALDIVKEGTSGVFFDEQSWEALADTIIRFKKSDFNPQAIREHAQLFSEEAFKKKFMHYLSINNLIK